MAIVNLLDEITDVIEEAADGVLLRPGIVADAVLKRLTELGLVGYVEAVDNPAHRGVATRGIFVYPSVCDPDDVRVLVVPLGDEEPT